MKRLISRVSAALLALLLLCGLLPPAPAAGGTPAPETTLSISTARELVQLSRDCTLDTYSQGLTVVLAADIDLAGSDFAPIPVFCGEFDGGGHTVRGFSYTGKGSDYGFIRYLQAGAVVHDLTVEGRVAPSGTKSGLGIIAGQNRGTIRDCAVSGAVAGDEDVGGIAGVNAETGSIHSCTSAADLTGNRRTGGAAGRNDGSISSCVNRGSVNIGENENAMDTGGIAGRNTGAITGSTNYGGVGYQHTGYNTGGVAGLQNGVVEHCVNYGSIQGRKDIGGIVGQFEPDSNLIYGEDPTKALSEALGSLTSLLSDLAAELSAAGANMVNDVSAINDALGSIGDTAQSSSADAADNAKAALDQVYDDAQEINASLSALIDSADAFTTAANSDLDALGAALTDLRKALDKGLTETGSELERAYDLVSFYIDMIHTDEETIQKAMEDLSAALKKLDQFLQAVSGALTNEALDFSQKLAAVQDATAYLNGFDLSTPVKNISSAVKDLTVQLGFIRDTVEDSGGILSKVASDTRNAMVEAADRLDGAGSALNGHAGDFSGQAAGHLKTVNGAVNSIEDTLKAWGEQTDTEGRAAFDSIYGQLDLINARVDQMTANASFANADITDTTNAIIRQLDAVRLAAAGLKETPEKKVDDVSDSVEDDGARGRVFSCRNEGAVSGDGNVGGVVGIVSLELDPDPENDLDIDADKILVDTTAVIKATTRACVNLGAVAAKNDCAGGIVGRGDLGAVLDCQNYGSVETAGGSYCGGVAGQARSPIRRCYVLCDLTGNDSVGGVAGSGRDIQDCRAMVRIDSDGEKLGAIAGGSDGTLSGNFFLAEELAGVDGVNYAGRAMPLSYADFTALEGLPARFYTFEVTFQADGQTLKTITVNYGGRLSPDQFPPLPGREGCSAAWEVFDADDITRSITVHAVYTPLVSAISTGEAQPRLLAEGSFSPDAALLLEDWTPDAYLIPAGYSLRAAYRYEISGGDAVEEVTLRVRCGDGRCRAGILQDGALAFPASTADGSYLVFRAPSSGTLLVLERQMNWLPIIMAAVGALLLLAAFIIMRIHQNPRRRPPEVPADNSSKSRGERPV
ncbi:peptidase [Pseudoflavonifractor phocaeensis]|uniref:peptidase n=1 Tax=Pseudoflavonifractor phocaeensis TaxID=1870988 RepID=UPI00210C38B0|nr:peptidase [Pseudoflavonifractor phocaeensis]MCQ4864251.1 peptidase [Pseudoflavonifractor phocaeensis]